MLIDMARLNATLLELRIETDKYVQAYIKRKEHLIIKIQRYYRRRILNKNKVNYTNHIRLLTKIMKRYEEATATNALSNLKRGFRALKISKNP